MVPVTKTCAFSLARTRTHTPILNTNVVESSDISGFRGSPQRRNTSDRPSDCLWGILRAKCATRLVLDTQTKLGFDRDAASWNHVAARGSNWWLIAFD